jgi:hypothetical protein
LTGDELAGLLDHFKDEPIPSALRVILQHELRGNRKRKPGPKRVRTPAACDSKDRTVVLARDQAQAIPCSAAWCL